MHLRFSAVPSLMKKLIALLVAALLLIEPATAWNKPGHMVMGAMIYQLLKGSDPEALIKLVALLKQHPQYESLWLPQIKQFTQSQEEAEQYLLMLAARWPDDARGSEYSHSDWHYVNFPFKPAYNKGTTPVSIGGNLIEAYEENVAILKGNAAESEKAVALCWVLHLAGDIHQPLHSSTYIAEKFPQGDRGGNLFFVKARTEDKGVNLHSFWDGLITGTPRYRETLNIATELRNRSDFKRAALRELGISNIKGWALESFAVAREKTYLNGQLEGGTSKEEAALLPAGYPKASKAIAERQLVLASYRMSDLLASLY